MGSPESSPVEQAVESPEDIMLTAALELATWDSEARRSGHGGLSFNRATRTPDSLLHTIFRCAREIRDARSAEATEESA